ncbi:MAG: hypothetical protein ABFQ89_02675 [Chloroflexota bacterium]
MIKHAVFEGLVSTINDEPVDVVYLGDSAFYVIDDAGFDRHVEAEGIDREVLEILTDALNVDREQAVEAALEMMGKDDLFSKAVIDASIDNVSQMLGKSLPEGMRAWLGLTGFRIIVDYDGHVVRVDQPSIQSPE